MTQEVFSTDKLTESQRRAVFHKDGPLLVLAGPGSGKTRVITARIAALIESGVSPYNICAITFTNKAAEEMRQRLANNLTPAGVRASTFHSLCVWILRVYADQASVKKNFSIYDPSDQKRCVKEAIKVCEEYRGPVASVVKAGLLRYGTGHNQEDIEKTIENAALYELDRLEKRLGVLATTANVAPMLGFLGTVTGMIKSFGTLA